MGQPEQHTSPQGKRDAVGVKALQSTLVGMGYAPDSVSHDVAHGISHLLHLLDPSLEDDIVAYYGLFGEERMALADIAARRGTTAEDMMAAIDDGIRKMAVTPEWQMLRGR